MRKFNDYIEIVSVILIKIYISLFHIDKVTDNVRSRVLKLA